MKLDDLRSILLSERETGRLTAVAPDIFIKGHAKLAAITGQVYSFEDPFSDEARALIDETLAIRETLQDLFAIRSRKILALAVMHAEGNYYDRDEVKRLIPAEKEMFDQITAGIGQCRAVLLDNAQHAPLVICQAVSEEDESGGTGHLADEEPAEIPRDVYRETMPVSHPCVLVHVLEDMDSFMGVDGRIYTLTKGDIVTLPERNAAVLSERNIVLNINVCK
jgi:DNA replication factor GINS